MGHDVAAAYEWASPALFHDAVVVQVPWTPKSPYAFVVLAVELFALVGAFEEVRTGAVNVVVDATSILVEVRNCLVGPETVKACRNCDTEVVDLAYRHYDVDDCKQGCSLDDPLAFQMVEGSLAQHVRMAWNLASLFVQQRVGPAAAHQRRRTEPSWS